MEPEKLKELYGQEYAGQYEHLWQHNPIWAPEAGHYVRTLGSLIEEDTKWLDAGCGTGWFLSQFPGVSRAGVDLSPSMLEHARKANPDALFFRNGDLRDDVPEWHDAWDLVSSTGQAWGYVDTMRDVQTVADNLARWTSPSGTCMVQPPDIFDLTGLVIPYYFHGETPPKGTARITGAIWNYYDEAGVHENQIWPSLDIWVEWLSVHFRTIEVVTWPHDPPFPYLYGGRRLLIARDKRADLDDGSATDVIVHPVPEVSAEEAGEPHASDPEELASSVPVPVPVPVPVADGERSADPLPTIYSRDHAVPGLPAGRLPGRGLYDQPLSYLISRVRPFDPAFWRSAARRGRKVMGR
jgi:SAM-dependent methyltransferase